MPYKNSSIAETWLARQWRPAPDPALGVTASIGP